MSQTAPDDYCRVCKCCFKQQFGNFSKIVHISSQNLFKPSQRKQSFGIVLSDLCDKVGLPLKNSEYHSTKICNTCSRKILKVHELVMELKSSVTCNTLHEKFQHHYQPKDVDARGASPFNRKSIDRVCSPRGSPGSISRTESKSARKKMLVQQRYKRLSHWPVVKK